MKTKRVSLSAIRKAATNEDSMTIHSEPDAPEVTSPEDVVAPPKRKRVRPVKASTTSASSDDKSGSDSADKLLGAVRNSTTSSAAADGESNKSAPGSDDLCDEKTVYIEGLPYDSTEEDIKAFFQSCGQIQSVRLPKWHDSGRLRGYGHVQFTSTSSVKEALNLDGKETQMRLRNLLSNIRQLELYRYFR